MTEAGWTADKPNASGWYWWRSAERSYEEVLMVLGDEKLGCPLFAMQDGEERSLSRLGGEWLGPISPTDRQQGRVAGAQDVLESFKKHHDACNDFRHCECAGGFWYEHIGKAWMDEKAAQAAQDEKGVGDGNIKMS